MAGYDFVGLRLAAFARKILLPPCGSKAFAAGLD